jgi:hypothetical protein
MDKDIFVHTTSAMWPLLWFFSSILLEAPEIWLDKRGGNIREALLYQLFGCWGYLPVIYLCVGGIYW